MSTTGNESEARAFFDRTESELLALAIESSRADWVFNTFITPDTEELASKASTRLIAATVHRAKEANRFRTVPLPGDLARKTRLLRLSLPLIAPPDPAEADELVRTVAAMQTTYATGRHAPPGRTEAVDLQELSRILGQSRNPVELENVWIGWHDIARPMRPQFTRYVELANRGARELDFADTGAMWRSKYDMDPDSFALEADRLWAQVRPLYRSLHAYVRRRLVERYGPELVPERGPIPGHLLGNMWAQSWENLYPDLAPPGGGATYDLTKILEGRHTSPTDMVRFAERFFVSLGLDPLPSTFWERSMFVRPRDREVVCHASAWDVDAVEDLRIKMCIEITAEDFHTIHHELGHNYYQRAYARQPFLFRESAHDGFHEAVGDTIGLSVTPEYLVQVGLLDRAPPPEGDIGLLLYTALQKIAFLPFGLLIDRWRWSVFSGEYGPDSYNRTWWELRERYQGIRPPVARGEDAFDAGAKFHVPANVPYMRYFLAHILQFQLHRALAREIDWTGPLHRCSIYGQRKAGKRLRAMLEMGSSREWPDALEAIGGDRRMEATGLLEYFAPLQRWLDEQNRGQPVGW